MAPLPQPLFRPQLQLPLQFRARLLAMYKIAESTPHTALPTVEATTRFAEIRDGRELAVDGARRVPA